MPVDYLQKILTAKVYDVAIETPLDLAPTLSRRLGNRVWVKREDQQSVFSFKLRGAYNKMAHLSAAERAKGVIAASAGNHAQGVALAAQQLGCKATIGMEILRQRQGPLDAIFVAIGGGGLIGGIAAYVKRVRPDVKIIGVQPSDSDAMARSLEAGRRVVLPHVGLFADGVAVKQVGKETFRLAKAYVDEVIRVDTDAG